MIVPANTYIASILAITENGLRPVLVEPSPETLQIDDSLIEQAITERTRAIMIVHLYGRCAYTHKIKEICRKYNLKLIEDNAQAQGCKAPSTSPKGESVTSASSTRISLPMGELEGASPVPSVMRPGIAFIQVRILVRLAMPELLLQTTKNSRMSYVRLAITARQ